MKKSLCIAIVLVLLLSMCSCSGNGGSSKGGSKTDKGSLDKPYALSDDIIIESYHFIPGSQFGTGKGETDNPITFKINNLSVQKEPGIYKWNFRDPPEDTSIFYVKFDIEISETAANESITLDDYLQIGTVNQDSIKNTLYAIPPKGDVASFSGYNWYDRFSVLPRTGAKWSVYTAVLLYYGDDLDYLIFTYCDADAQRKDVFVKVR